MTASDMNKTAPNVTVMPQKKEKKVRASGMDAPFFMLVCTLLFIGLVIVYSASYSLALRDHDNTYYYILRQAGFAAVGFLAMLGISRVDYRLLKKWWLVILALSVLALVSVELFGVVRNFSKRWIIIAGIQFQPSELTKIGLIVFFAAFIDRYYDKMKTLRYGLLPYIGTMAVVGVLLYRQPHMSALILIMATCLVMIFVGGLAWKWIISGGVLVGAAVGYLVLFTNFLGYIQRRIDAWQNPYADPLGSGFQTIQSLYAVGSGGLFGLGLGNGRQKQLYLPESHNDYIFSIACEELGFVGAILIVLLFAAFIIRGFYIAFHARDRFGTMLAVGIMTMLSLQIIINIAVVTNAMPVTGMSLPFFSYGGTSLVVLLCEMGLMLSVSRHIPLKKEG